MRRFYSDEGVKERKETIKFKVLTGADQKRKPSDLSDPGQDRVDVCVKMLMVHNFKVQKIIQAFADQHDKKRQAKELGINYKDLLAMEGSD